MKIIKCKNCGAQLDTKKVVGGVIECEYCHSKHTVALSADGKAEQFLAAGELALSACKFDDAYEAYKKAAESDGNEPEAYFGMALAEHKVQYIKDLVNNRLQPVCHDVTDRVFSRNKNYNAALERATPEQHAEYKRKAGEIDYIRERFYKLKSEGKAYDCFICVKVTGDDGRKTRDSDSANDIYYHLKDKGYSPFYSEREIQNATGADYEALILYALYSSPCMLIVCGDESFLQTPWVKNEYTRFISLINDEKKEYDSIAIGFFDKTIERLPGRNGRLQGVCLKNPDAYGKIADFVDAHLEMNVVGAAASQISRKTYDSVVHKKKAAVKSQIQKRTLEKIAQTALSVSEQSMLDIAKSMLDGGNFAAAKSRCDAILQTNKSCAEAYWISFLAENECKTAEEFEKSTKYVSDFGRLESAIATADGALKQKCYDALYNRAMACKRLGVYEEYISLPDSDPQKIKELTTAMFSALLYGKSYGNDRTVFDALIKTVDDTDTYIDMNLRFADRMFGCDPDGALPYYKAVKDVDESNGRALFEIFKTANGIKTTVDMAKYLSGEENRKKIEKSVFSYGFNLYAVDRMLFACLHNPSLLPKCNTARIDFVLSLIPPDETELYREYLLKTVNWLLIEGSYDDAGKYNDMIIAADMYDHKAYFKRLYIKRKTLNPFVFAEDGAKLYDDPDFSKAIDAYALKHNYGKNIYIAFADALRKQRDKSLFQLQLNEDGLKMEISQTATFYLEWQSINNYSTIVDKYYYRKDKKGVIILVKAKDFACMNYADSDEIKRGEKIIKKNPLAERRKELAKRLAIALIPGILAIGLIALGIALGIKTAASDSLDVLHVFWCGMPILLGTAACIYATCSLIRGSSLNAIAYSFTFAAIVFAALFSAFMAFVLAKPELFTIPTWVAVLALIAGVILLAQFIGGLAEEHKEGYFMFGMRCDDELRPSAKINYAFSVLVTVLLSVASISFAISVQKDSGLFWIMILLVMASGIIKLLVHPFMLLGVVEDRRDDNLFIICAVLNCIQALLFVLYALNLLGDGGVIALG